MNPKKVRILGAVTAGIGLLLMLVAGFGLLARIYSNQFENWIWIKLSIWVLFGALFVVIKRAPGFAFVLWWVVLALGLVSTIMVYFRPFLS